jgi:hypothetical protein
MTYLISERSVSQDPLYILVLQGLSAGLVSLHQILPKCVPAIADSAKKTQAIRKTLQFDLSIILLRLDQSQENWVFIYPWPWPSHAKRCGLSPKTWPRPTVTLYRTQTKKVLEPVWPLHWVIFINRPWKHICNAGWLYVSSVFNDLLAFRIAAFTQGFPCKCKIQYHAGKLNNLEYIKYLSTPARRGVTQ